MRIGCPMATERRMEGCGSVVPWQRNGGWEGTERLYGVVGEKSIDFPRIPYRLFPDTSVHPLGQYGNNDLFVWENRSFPSVGKSANVRRREATRAWNGERGAQMCGSFCMSWKAEVRCGGTSVWRIDGVSMLKLNGGTQQWVRWCGDECGKVRYSEGMVQWIGRRKVRCGGRVGW